MNLREPFRSAIVLVVFAALFLFLSLYSYTRQSATWDEPQHITRGYLGWQGDHRLDPEHPPFLRLWAALPLTMMGDIKCDVSVINQVSPIDWVGIGQFQYAHQFLYKMNDADRLLYRARFMIVLLAVLLGALVYCWTRDWLGFWPAVMALALYCFEPNILAHGSLVTTDMAITCFMFGSLYFLWRIARRFSMGNLIGLSLFFVLAVTSKFSSLILGPIIFLLLAIHVSREGSWARKNTRLAKAAIAGGIIVWLALISWLGVWATYGFRFNPSATADWVYKFHEDPTVVARTPRLAPLIAWSDQHRLLPNAFSQGFLLGQAKAQVRGAFLAGQTSGTGWWYYFPYAFAVKTPTALLALLAVGIVIVAQLWRKSLDTAIFVLLPIGFYLGTAMLQKLNIGLRHILPLYPLAIVLCGVAIAWLFRRERKFLIGSLMAVCLMEGIEFSRMYPHPLAFFNSLAGGPENGHNCLVDSNLDWGQDLKGLKQWMLANNVKHINLAYFGTADPAYYDIDQTPLPGAPFFDMNRVAAPQLPGYVAMSSTILSGVYGGEGERSFYAPLRKMEPVAVLGFSINIYHIEKPWWQ